MVALAPSARDAPEGEMRSSLSNRRSLRLTSLVGIRDALPDKGRLKLERVGEVQEQALQQSVFDKKYVLGEVIGVGGMSRVRLATTRSDNRKVAVKITESTDDDLRQLTRNEYELMRTLRFPSIVQVEGLYQTQQCLLMCMEHCDNGCLDSYLKRKKNRFVESQAVQLFSQLVGGVNYLHLHRIVHRDLKPGNLLLQNHATVLKISDFNSAKRIGGCAGGSLMLTDRGTHLYSAPELRFGRQWNERVDIWAIGLCFFYMLRAEIPFNIQDRGDAALLRAGELPMMPWWSFTDMVRNLLLQCLTVNPYDRPPAMELMLHPIFGNNWWLDHDRLPAQRDASNHEVRVAGFTCAGHGQLYLSSCGLLLMSTNRCVETEPSCQSNGLLCQSNGFCRQTTPQPACESPKSQFLDTWKESRSGVDALQRLVTNRCMRTSEKQEFLPSVSRSGSADGSTDPGGASAYSSSCGMSRSPSPKAKSPVRSPKRVFRAQKRDFTKFFTTHGAFEAV